MTIPDLSAAHRQFRDFKAKHPEYLLLFHVGDAYHALNGDADTLRRTLGLDIVQSEPPSLAIPADRLEVTLRRIIAAGHRVAICERKDDQSQ